MVMLSSGVMSQTRLGFHVQEHKTQKPAGEARVCICMVMRKKGVVTTSRGLERTKKWGRSSLRRTDQSFSLFNRFFSSVVSVARSRKSFNSIQEAFDSRRSIIPGAGQGSARVSRGETMFLATGS